MSTSSAGTSINFGSQALPDPESEAEGEIGLPSGLDAPGRPHDGARLPTLAATSSVAAEAEQGDGPAAASASGSAVSETNVASRAVSVVVGPHGAAAACELGVAVVGPHGAAAASSIGVVSAGPGGAAAAGNGANSSIVTSDAAANGHELFHDLREALEERLARLEQENRDLRKLVGPNGGTRRR